MFRQSVLIGKEASPHFMLHRILCSIYIKIVVLFVRTRVHSDNARALYEASTLSRVQPCALLN